MELMLGTYTPKLDDKGRLILPSKFRDVLRAGLVLTRGQERCLYIMSNNEFESLYRKIQDSDIANKRAYARMFTADAMSDTPDKQGRILIPATLRSYAGLDSALDREIVVIGAGSRLELWNKAAWSEYQAANVELYATMTEGVF